MNTFTTRALSVCTGLVLGMSVSTAAWSAKSLEDVMKDRGLTQKDILAAAKTYTPTGGRDEYLAFASGGQSGQVIVYGIPSMRILKYIGVFTPEPWQGYGFDDNQKGCYIRVKPMAKSNGEIPTTRAFLKQKVNTMVSIFL